MANEFLKKIILEELQKVLKEQDGGMRKGATSKKIKDPKVVELQKLLISKDFDVGVPDGVPGPKLYKALSKIAGVSTNQLEMDFASAPAEMADNFITVIGKNPGMVNKAKKDVVAAKVADTTASVDKTMKDLESEKDKKRFPGIQGKTDSGPSASPKGKQVDSPPPSVATTTGMMPSVKDTPKEGDEMKGELGPVIYHNGKWIPKSEYEQLQKGLEEALVREISKLLKTL